MSSSSEHKGQGDASPKSLTSLPEYKTKYKKRGLAIIFNQENFVTKKKRRGSTRDKENLTERFLELGFDVKAYDDLSKEAMWNVINKAAHDDHTDSDCFVCVFLSHGEDGHISARDGEVNIQNVTARFKGDECKSLVGKPKIFIFQACRGDTFGDNPVTPMGADDSEEEEEPADIYTLPAGADFLMCYCVSKGFMAFRHVEDGSFYIQDLCETLKEAGSSMEFTELLTLVNLKVSRRSPIGRKQMPCFTSMLTKKLYFRPKQ